ncbi:MAG: Rnase Y domain-containing protein, partial [Oscillospiraceae bacterium]|nr:Rnase Y domain-containing protein [Oscillospiraceae bacterium]
MPTSPLFYIISAIAVIVLIVFAFFIGIIFRKRVSEREIQSAEEKAKKIINESIKAAESKKREALLEAKEEIHKNRSE